MSIMKSKIVKKVSALAVTAAMTFGLMAPMAATNVNAADSLDSSSNIESKYASEGYTLKWNDEFSGSTLNTKDWNVEAHEPGWVNQELQRYVSESDMNDNIKLKDGVLTILPTAKKKDNASATVSEVLKSNTFDATNWTSGTNEGGEATFDYKDGKAVISIAKSGTVNYGVQLQQTNLTLVPNHKYQLKMKATASAARAVEISFLDPDNGYDWYGGAKKIITTDANGEISIDFTVPADKKESKTIALQINFGLITDDNKEFEAASGAAEVTLSAPSLVDLSANPAADVKTAYDYTSGRINTQNKHDFKYGRFEARAKVPSGNGYLPAFWLMATDETNYGQWPQCGEVDIMEVMGQDITKSYHTIHYGYDANTGHSQNQGTYVLSGDGSFKDEWHTFTLDWEPGKLTWYVDGKEVYTTNNWYTGKDKESQLTYPAPFDQEFYVILNLAVGGSWVGYPDQAVVDDMPNQSFDIDYVRVYQKDEAVYEAAEANCKAPESPKATFREADANGNYVLNADFSKDISASDASNNWTLHLESDAEGTAYKVENNAIKISPKAVGSQNHSVQLKQEKIPMYRGWEYELTFDAYADENRTIIADIEGPDHGWTRYMADTTFDLTTEKKTYTKTFTMEEATDANGSLEFNLGNQKSTAGVTISNVKLTHKSGTLIPEDNSKTIRADGNYVYNGTFDQGENRLGYWDIAGDKANVSVTNKNKVRMLKVEVKDAANPISISQSELPALAKGDYEVSFDSYFEGNADASGLSVKVANEEYIPELSSTSKKYSKKFKVDKSLERKDSNITLTFSKPGVYYLDNLMLSEASLLKNGSFVSGVSGFAPYIYTNDLASYVVDNINNDSAFVMTINNTGTEAWHVQLNQDNI
ncbi:MAG: carbohydrate binding domain-containing protein, partial [Lachnospiraceae bacterium]|nr:carbohydrate binding domain-containing protein [Lachnospiraceae bacterium]